MKPLRIEPLPIDVIHDRDTAQDNSIRARPARRILIVEDNYFVAHQCESALVEAGFAVVDIVSSAEEAVKVALDRRPDLILMDIFLVGKADGIDAAMEIFERSGIRSVFASAITDPAAKGRADAARPLAWLAKPFSDRKLVVTVTSAIGEIDGMSQSHT